MSTVTEKAPIMATEIDWSSDFSYFPEEVDNISKKVDSYGEGLEKVQKDTRSCIGQIYQDQESLIEELRNHERLAKKTDELKTRLIQSFSKLKTLEDSIKSINDSVQDLIRNIKIQFCECPKDEFIKKFEHHHKTLKLEETAVKTIIAQFDTFKEYGHLLNLYLDTHKGLLSDLQNCHREFLEKAIIPFYQVTYRSEQPDTTRFTWIRDSISLTFAAKSSNLPAAISGYLPSVEHFRQEIETYLAIIPS